MPYIDVFKYLINNRSDFVENIKRSKQILNWVTESFKLFYFYNKV